MTDKVMTDELMTDELVEAAIAHMEGHLPHDMGCNFFHAPPRACDCGTDAVIQKFRAALPRIKAEMAVVEAAKMWKEKRYLSDCNSVGVVAAQLQPKDLVDAAPKTVVLFDAVQALQEVKDE